MQFDARAYLRPYEDRDPAGDIFRVTHESYILSGRIMSTSDAWFTVLTDQRQRIIDIAMSEEQRPNVERLKKLQIRAGVRAHDVDFLRFGMPSLLWIKADGGIIGTLTPEQKKNRVAREMLETRRLLAAP